MLRVRAPTVHWVCVIILALISHSNTRHPNLATV